MNKPVDCQMGNYQRLKRVYILEMKKKKIVWSSSLAINNRRVHWAQDSLLTEMKDPALCDFNVWCQCVIRTAFGEIASLSLPSKTSKGHICVIARDDFFFIFFYYHFTWPRCLGTKVYNGRLLLAWHCRGDLLLLLKKHTHLLVVFSYSICVFTRLRVPSDGKSLFQFYIILCYNIYLLLFHILFSNIHSWNVGAN